MMRGRGSGGGSRTRPGRGRGGGPPRGRNFSTPHKQPVEVDREKVCPFLLRVFTKIGGHHDSADFAVEGKVPEPEIQIYTWMDATLRELTDMLKEVLPSVRARDTVISFSFVYAHKDGLYAMKEAGMVHSVPKKEDDDRKTLHELQFEIGDYLDVAVFREKKI